MSNGIKYVKINGNDLEVDLLNDPDVFLKDFEKLSTDDKAKAAMGMILLEFGLLKKNDRYVEVAEKLLDNLHLWIF